MEGIEFWKAKFFESQEKCCKLVDAVAALTKTVTSQATIISKLTAKLVDGEDYLVEDNNLVEEESLVGEELVGEELVGEEDGDLDAMFIDADGFLLADAISLHLKEEGIWAKEGTRKKYTSSINTFNAAMRQLSLNWRTLTHATFKSLLEKNMSKATCHKTALRAVAKLLGSGPASGFITAIRDAKGLRAPKKRSHCKGLHVDDLNRH